MTRPWFELLDLELGSISAWHSGWVRKADRIDQLSWVDQACLRSCE